MSEYSAVSRLAEEAYGVFDTATSRAKEIFQPTVRLGVTGLSRAGKTVFITSLIHNLIHGKRLPFFNAKYSGRISKVYLQPQPDDDVPRFAYEGHLKSLTDERLWPESTRSISQLRLTIEYETTNSWGKMFSPGKLNLDIIDYPGEWLLDLPLLSQDFATFSKNAVEMAKSYPRSELSGKWLDLAGQIDPDADFEDPPIIELAEAFSTYLKDCKHDKRAFSTLPPGRFLLPGDLEGSPAVTFAPLLNIEGMTAKPNSMLAIMERRFESYKSKVIRPFYQNHFARLDRQVILIDALQALNAGREAVVDLERALGDILLSFNTGKNSFPSNLFTRRIDKILVAATKADHLHHESHDHLQAIVQRLVNRALVKIDATGAEVDVLAMAAIRATKEATHKDGDDEFQLIVGTPREGEQLGDETFDGKTQKAIFPGDLPENSDSIFKVVDSDHEEEFDDLKHLNFVRFRPPALNANAPKNEIDIPHIRLDRALEFLIGDRLL